MSELIEGYLRDHLSVRGVRYFRGHHDDEYFFLVDALIAGGHGRLHVHLDADPNGTITVSISPGRYFPADQRDRLGELVARWSTDGAGARATVEPSCDPALVGVTAVGVDRPADAAALARFVDGTVGAAIELFAGMRQAVSSGQLPPLRDAG